MIDRRLGTALLRGSLRPDGNQLVLVLGLRQRRNHITEADRGNGDETVVGRLVHFPALPESEEDSTEDDVAADDRQDDGQRDADLVEVLVVGCIVVVLLLSAAIIHHLGPAYLLDS